MTVKPANLRGTDSEVVGAPMSSLPGKVVAHLELMRPYTMAYAALLSVAGAMVVGGSTKRARGRVWLAAQVTVSGWLAGHYIGDYLDKDMDALSKPGRPLPSGRISPREAVAAAVILIGLGLTGALRLGRTNFLLAVFTTILGIAYSKTFKGLGVLGNLDRGVLGACAVLFGGIASAGRPSTSLVLLALSTICHDGASNLVGTLRDVEGDRAAGCKTLPVARGIAYSAGIARVLAALGWSGGLLTLLLVRRGRIATTLFALASLVAAIVYGGLLGWHRPITRPAALRAHELLVVERMLLCSAFVAARAPRLSVLLLLLSLPASVALQTLMRQRHEGLA